jgi:hypothetical protein
MVNFSRYRGGSVEAEDIRTASKDAPPIDLEQKRLSWLIQQRFL